MYTQVDIYFELETNAYFTHKRNMTSGYAYEHVYTSGYLLWTGNWYQIHTQAQYSIRIIGTKGGFIAVIRLAIIVPDMLSVLAMRYGWMDHNNYRDGTVPSLYKFVKACASFQIRKIAGCACTGNARNVFPAAEG